MGVSVILILLAGIQYFCKGEECSCIVNDRPQKYCIENCYLNDSLIESNLTCQRDVCLSQINVWLRSAGQDYSRPWVQTSVSRNLDLKVELTRDAIQHFKALSASYGFTCDIQIYPGAAFEAESQRSSDPFPPSCSALSDDFGSGPIPLLGEGIQPIRFYSNIIGTQQTSFRVKSPDLPNQDATGVGVSCRVGKRQSLEWKSPVTFPMKLKTRGIGFTSIESPKISTHRVTRFRSMAIVNWNCPEIPAYSGFEVLAVKISAESNLGFDCTSCLQNLSLCQNCWFAMKDGGSSQSDNQPSVYRQFIADWRVTNATFPLIHNPWPKTDLGSHKKSQDEVARANTSTGYEESFTPGKIDLNSIESKGALDGQVLLAAVRPRGGEWSGVSAARLEKSKANPRLLLSINLETWSDQIKKFFRWNSLRFANHVDDYTKGRLNLYLASVTLEREIEVFTPDLLSTKPFITAYGRGLAPTFKHKNLNIDPEVDEVDYISGCFNHLTIRWFYSLTKRGQPIIAMKLAGTPGNEEASKVVDGKLRIIDTENYETLLQRKFLPSGFQCQQFSSQVIWLERQTNGIKVFSGHLTRAMIAKNFSSVEEILTKPTANCSLTNAAIVSTATAIRRSYPKEETIFIVNDGIWSVSFRPDPQETTCQRIVHGQNIDGEGIQIQKISSIAADWERIYILESSIPGIHIFDSLTGLYLRSVSTIFVPNPQLDPLSINLQQRVLNNPNRFMLPLHLNSTVFDLKVDPAVNMMEAYPLACVFPTISTEFFNMISSEVGELAVRISWESGCVNMIRPAVKVQVKYIEISKDRFNGSVAIPCRNLRCPCETGLGSCSEVSARPTSDDTTLVSLPLESGKLYHLEVSATPVSPKPLVLKWWYDVPMPHTVTQVVAAEYESPTGNFSVALVLLIILLGVALVAIALLLYMYKTKWYVYRSLSRLSKKMIEMEEPIGQGHFGEVYKAKVTLSNKKVILAAVKTLKLTKEDNDRHKQQFLEEAILISKMDNSHIIRTIGIAMDSKPILLALEYMNGGSLEGYLRKVDQRETLNFKGRTNMSYEISGRVPGLPFCAAAPECFPPEEVTSKNELNGLSRDEREASHLLPAKFTTKSDVYAFGVLLYEIFTLGMFPYFAWHTDRFSVFSRVRDWVVHQRLTVLNLDDDASQEIAEYIPDCIKEIMRRCMTFEAQLRPSFGMASKERQSILQLLHGASSGTATLTMVPSSPENGSDFYIVENYDATVTGEEELSSDEIIDSDMVEADLETVQNTDGINMGIVFHPLRNGLNTFNQTPNGVRIHPNREGRAEVTV